MTTLQPTEEMKATITALFQEQLDKSGNEESKAKFLKWFSLERLLDFFNVAVNVLTPDDGYSLKTNGFTIKYLIYHGMGHSWGIFKDDKSGKYFHQMVGGSDGWGARANNERVEKLTFDDYKDKLKSLDDLLPELVLDRYICG